MKESVRRTVLFALERFLVRGAHYRFLFVIAVIGLISLAGGMALVAVDDSVVDTREAVWWAFLRLSDPGYLGDDEGTLRRLISTVLTILGYVVFLGAMVAILTQWLNATLARLELGLTPVRIDGHVVIVGWTDRTAIICRDLFESEGRLRRWLEFRGVRRLRIAILSRTVGPGRMQELEDAVGPKLRRSGVILRSGSPLSTAHLERVDVPHAASVVIPGIETTSERADAHDDVVIKTLCAVGASVPAGTDAPPCVCEIFDARKIPVARRAYPGVLEVIASDVVVGRLLAYGIWQPGLSQVFAELLTHGVGATLYMFIWDEAPAPFDEAFGRLQGGIALGVVRGETEYTCTLSPAPDVMVHTGDRLVVVGHAYGDLRLGPATASDPAVLELREPPEGAMSVLVLGWSRRIPDALAELERMAHGDCSVTVVSTAPVEDRAREFDEAGVELRHVRVHHLRGEITVPTVLEPLELVAFDRILIVASDASRSQGSGDARVVSAYHAVSSVLGEGGPPMVLEVAEPANVDLFDGRRTDVVVSTQVLAHLLAQVTLRRELRVVVDDVFGSGPSELRFVEPVGPATIFGRIAAAARARGTIALGIRRGGVGGPLLLSPAPDEEVDPAAGDEVVLLRGVD